MTRISFYKASRRLHSDANHLASDTVQQRNVNAGHFFGLSAECGLKHLLFLCGGLQRDSITGDLAGGPRPHANQLVDASGLATNYRALVGGNTHSKYLLQAPSLAGLQSWKAEFRYYDESHSDYPAGSEPDWKAASLEIQAALDAAMLDGHPIY
jgi:hypothetical protein